MQTRLTVWGRSQRWKDELCHCRMPVQAPQDQADHLVQQLQPTAGFIGWQAITYHTRKPIMSYLQQHPLLVCRTLPVELG